ncbi:MAG: shikimate dehydrogenase, partial [Bacteroidales bacterium]|nr:shikimate dehydrogenase [Bacteroidales bacterium]
MKQVYGLVGYPLGHSFSKDFFNNKFLSEKLDAEYVNFELP